MRQRTLGASGIGVSAIGLGCWGMSGSYGPADEAESVATLHHALDLGVNFIDTADSYGEDGHNEALIGRTLEGRRQGFVLATKTGWVKRAGPDGKEVVGVDGRPERIRLVCEASLARLRTDVIDLYYLHRVDPGVPVEESVGAMSELVTSGKVRFLGLSEVSENTLRRAHTVYPITAPPVGVFALDPGAGGDGDAGVPGAGHRLRTVQPAGPGLPDRGGDGAGRRASAH